MKHINRKATENGTSLLARSWLPVAVMVCFVSLAPAAQASTVGFHGITSNDLDNVATGEAQFTVDVTDSDDNQVLFTFLNSGPVASSITQVYFDDGSLLGIASVDNTVDGVRFTEDDEDKVTPPKLPGGDTIDPPFEVTAGFLADAENPQPDNGINPGESLGILFSLQGDQSFGNVIEELASGELRIGIHAQSIDGGGSESFVNNPVPLPAGLWLFGSALAALTGIGWRRRRAWPG